MEPGQACGPRGARRFSAWRLFSTLFRACPIATPFPRKLRPTTAHASRRQIFSAPRRAPQLPLVQVPVTGFAQIPVAGPAVIIVAVIAALRRSLRDAAVGASGLRGAGPGVCPFEPRAPRRRRCVAGGGRLRQDGPQGAREAGDQVGEVADRGRQLCQGSAGHV